MRELRVWLLLCVALGMTHLAGAQSNTSISRNRISKTSTSDTWITTWAASPQAALPDPDEPLLKIDGQTVRERVRVSIGGDRICIRLSNEYGSSPLLVGSMTVAMTVAVPKEPASVRPGSVQAVTFGGRRSITIPAGAPMLSDPVAFPVGDGGEISISVYFPNKVTTPTLHSLALKTAVVSQRGDYTGAEKIEGPTPGSSVSESSVSESSVALSAVLVPARPGQRLVVAMGDSLTDGDMSTVDADRTWPGDLIRRLAARVASRVAKSPDDSSLAVVNAGIAGNRLLSDGFGSSGLARFDRDALSQAGVTHIVLFEGINDIALPGAKLNGRYLADPAEARSAEEVIGAYRQLIARAHARGVKLIGATITPFEGVAVPGYYSESKDAVRRTVNQWIRSSGAFDGVIDFDAVLRDPAHPGRLLPRFASGDHLHPNDAGYQAMADAIDLAIFR